MTLCALLSTPNRSLDRKSVTGNRKKITSSPLSFSCWFLFLDCSQRGTLQQRLMRNNLLNDRMKSGQDLMTDWGFKEFLCDFENMLGWLLP